MKLKHIWPRVLGVILPLALGLSLVGCNEEIDQGKVLRSENERAFLAFADSAGYEKVTLPGFFGDGYVYMKWTQRGEGATSPKKTDKVRLRYRFYQLTSWRGIGGGLIYTNYTEENPKPKDLLGELEGVRIALQNMKVGDEAFVVIPWYLGGGPGGRELDGSKLPGYTSLIYQIQLLGIND